MSLRGKRLPFTKALDTRPHPSPKLDVRSEALCEKGECFGSEQPPHTARSLAGGEERKPVRDTRLCVGSVKGQGGHSVLQVAVGRRGLSGDPAVRKAWCGRLAVSLLLKDCSL